MSENLDITDLLILFIVVFMTLLSLYGVFKFIEIYWESIIQEKIITLSQKILILEIY